MTTLQLIQANPKTNIKGSLGSRNRCPVAVNVMFSKGLIWCITSQSAIYRIGKFNETIALNELPEQVLIQLNEQINL